MFSASVVYSHFVLMMILWKFMQVVAKQRLEANSLTRNSKLTKSWEWKLWGKKKCRLRRLRPSVSKPSKLYANCIAWKPENWRESPRKQSLRKASYMNTQSNITSSRYVKAHNHIIPHRSKHEILTDCIIPRRTFLSHIRIRSTIPPTWHLCREHYRAH